MTKKTDKLELNLDSGYGKDDSVENYVKIDDVLGLEGRTDDPDNPYPGERWFREDEGVIREAYVDSNGNINKVDKKSIYDVSSEAIIEDFEGKTVSDVTTLTTSGSPEFEIIQQDGSDWASVSFDSEDDVGAIGVDTGVADKRGIAARIDIEGGSETYADGFSGDLIASEGLALSDGDLFARIRDGSPSEIDLIQSEGQEGTYGTQVEFDIPFFEIHENYFEIRYGNFDDGQRVFLEVETVDDRYFDTAEASTEVNDFRTLSIGNSSSFEPPGSIAADYLGEAIYDGQLSPAFAHSDLADAPSSAHHTQPTDEEQTFTVPSNTEEATTVTLSQPYKSGIANSGFTSGTDISPSNDADSYVQDYVTDGDDNITDVVVYAHNTTGNPLDIDVRFFGVPA
jgi:hypothetical protein